MDTAIARADIATRSFEYLVGEPGASDTFYPRPDSAEATVFFASLGPSAGIHRLDLASGEVSLVRAAGGAILSPGGTRYLYWTDPSALWASDLDGGGEVEVAADPGPFHASRAVGHPTKLGSSTRDGTTRSAVTTSRR